MSIAFESTEVQLHKLRERLRLMSDEKLVKFGKMVRGLIEPRVGLTPDPWEGAIAGGACGVEAKTPEGGRPSADVT